MRCALLPIVGFFAALFTSGPVAAGASEAARREAHARHIQMLIERVNAEVKAENAAAAEQKSPASGLRPECRNDKCYYVDRNGNVAIKGDFHVTRSDPLQEFSEGLAAVAIGDGLYGYINEEAKWVIRPRFKWAGPFVDGLAVAESVDGLYGYINKEGKWVIQPRFKEAHPFREGRARAIPEGGQWMGYIDHRGQWAIEPKYGIPTFLGIVYPYDFSEGLAVATVRGPNGFSLGQGYLDPNGNWVIGPGLTSASSFHDGVAVVEDPGKYSSKEAYGGGYEVIDAKLIDRTGRQLTPERDREWILRHIDLSTLR